jgi:hypothetical protein
MATATGWVAPTSALKYGGALARDQRATSDDTAMAKAAGPTPGGDHAVFDLDHPLAWFAVLAAATVGLMAYSTTVRVGPVKAALELGK